LPAETPPESPLERTKREFEESRAALRAAEAERANQERAYVSNRGALRRGVDSLLGRGKSRFKESESNMNAAAAAHARKLEAYLGGILAEKTGEKWGAQDRRDRILARFASRDLVTKGERSIAAAREEAKAGKESGAAAKLLGWCAERNAWFDRTFENKYVARTMRALAYSAAGAGLATAFGAVALPGTFGYFAWRFAKSVGVGVGVGGAAGIAYNESLGKRAARDLKREQEKLRTGMGSMDAARIANLRDRYRTGNAEAIARKRRNVEAAAAFIAGAGWNLEQFLVNPDIPGVHGNGIAETPPVNPPPESAPVPLAPGVPELQIAPPEPPLEAHPPMPGIDVQAGKGFGYEWMAKRVEERLQGLHLNADDYPPGSDVRQLLEASQDPSDPNHIDTVVHRLATIHGFYHADGTSEIIRPEDHMSIGADGQLHVGAAPKTGIEIPSAGASMPVPEAVPMEAPNPPITVPSPAPEIHSINPTEQPGFMSPREGIDIKAPAAGAFAPAAVAAAYMATGEKPGMESRPGSDAADSESAVSAESAPALTTDSEGRNLIANGSEVERELYALKLAKERPETPFMYLKKVRSGFLGLFTKDVWFMAYAEKGGDPGVFETVNNRDWRAVNLSRPGAAPAADEGGRGAA
jgi:hypothetical protein